MIIVLIAECPMALKYFLYQDFEDRNYFRLSFLTCIRAFICAWMKMVYFNHYKQVGK